MTTHGEKFISVTVESEFDITINKQRSTRSNNIKEQQQQPAYLNFVTYSVL